MKNVIKKLLSLTLAAALLLCAVPFQAMASDTGITVVIVDESKNELARFDKTPSNGKSAVVADLLNYALKNGLVAGYGAGELEFVHAYVYPAEGEKGYIAADYTLSVGDSVRIATKVAESNEGAGEITDPAEPTVEPIKFVVKVNTSDNTVFSGSVTPSNGEYTLAKNLLTYGWNKAWADNYTVDHAWSSNQKANIGSDAKVYAGDTVSFLLVDKKNTNSGSTNSGSNNTEVDDEFFKDIWLQIFVNDNISKYDKMIKLNDYTMVKDGKVTKDELWSIITKYYKATDSNKGITWRGMYVENEKIDATNWVEGNYKNVTSIDGLNELRQEGTVVLKVRIRDVKKAATTSGTADSTNPKTGDMIFVPAMVMVASAAAVAFIYMDSKKRVVR